MASHLSFPVYVLPFLQKAQPEAVMFFNVVLFASAFLRGEKRRASGDEVAAGWLAGLMCGAGLTLFEYIGSGYDPPSAFIGNFVGERFVLAGLVTMIAGGWAARRAAVGRSWKPAAIYLPCALAAASATAWLTSSATTYDTANESAIFSALIVFIVAVLVFLIPGALSEASGREHKTGGELFEELKQRKESDPR